LFGNSRSYCCEWGYFWLYNRVISRGPFIGHLTAAWSLNENTRRRSLKPLGCSQDTRSGEILGPIFSSLIELYLVKGLSISENM